MSPRVRLTIGLALAVVLLYGAWGPLHFPVTPDTTWGTTRYVQIRSVVGERVYPPQVDLFGHTVLTRWEERDEQLGVTVVRERTLNYFALALSVCLTGVAAGVVGWGLSGAAGRKRGELGSPPEQEMKPGQSRATGR
jgi:hypothetical protein